MRTRALGAIIAGGRSTRYGAPKALARVGGVRVVDRVASALRAVVAAADIVAIVNDAALGDEIALPWRSDVLAGVGAVAGVHAALAWALERGCAGALVVACDMPFVESALLRAILDAAEPAVAPDAVLPESAGPRGVEPLCAWYATSCISAIEAAAARGDGRMIGFHSDIAVTRIPLAQVRAFGDPSLLFRNLNTPADLLDAERHAAAEP
ncbi:MAG: molybdenum cofactor guanylyltransferase [Gemmatimonadota bacterium]